MIFPLLNTAVAMSGIGELWDSLRRAGLEELAPQLVRHGITSLNQLVLQAEDLRSSGLLRWQIEAILAAAPSLTAGSEEGAPPDHRPDLPSRQTGKRANLQAALEAATPNQRQKSLQDLDRDILARSTHPAIEARIRTYMAICRAWEVAAFPLDTTNVRCFGASLKAGGYKSSAVYYQAVMSHQQRAFRTQIPPIVKQCVRDCIRSIQRGLGVSQLKDAFNGLLIGNIEPRDDGEAFSFDNVSHCRDMAVIGLCFMLREAEMANARARDIKLEGRNVLLTIPLHKTDPLGKFTVRALSCSCNIRTHNLCVWHSTERHLVRLEAHPARASGPQFPLFPDEAGRTASKQKFIEAIRTVIAKTDTPMTRQGPDGQETQRFHGHCLRISGAQMLSSSGVELSLIQLLGRWTSTAVLRYTQDSALLRVPSIPQQVLGSASAQSQPVQLRLAPPVQAETRVDTAVPAANRSARQESSAPSVRALRAEMDQIKKAIHNPPQTFVFRPRARILHKASVHEADNEPTRWRTVCGWNYGTSTFLRTNCEQDGNRKCRKCFDMQYSSSESGDSSSELSGLESSSDSSAEG